MKKLMFLAGLIATPAIAATKPPLPGIFAEARKAVADTLRDPGSAQFRALRTKVDSGVQIVCGEVNGKNAYGGYVGFRTFIYVPRAAVAAIAPDEFTWAEMSADDRATSNSLFMRCL